MNEDDWERLYALFVAAGLSFVVDGKRYGTDQGEPKPDSEGREGIGDGSPKGLSLRSPARQAPSDARGEPRLSFTKKARDVGSDDTKAGA